MFAILYTSVAACDSVVRTDYSMRLHNLQILGDSEHQFRSVLYQLNELIGRAEGMTDEAKRDQLFFKMRMFPTLKERMIRDYDPKPEHEKSITILTNIIRDQIANMKSMRTYADNYAQRPQAKNTSQPTADEAYGLGLKGGGPKGKKGDGKGKKGKDGK